MNIECDNKKFKFVSPVCRGNSASKTMFINYNQCAFTYFVCEQCMKSMSRDSINDGHTGIVRKGVDLNLYMEREKEQ